jgi:hypothetical protein
MHAHARMRVYACFSLISGQRRRSQQMINFLNDLQINGICKLCILSLQRRKTIALLSAGSRFVIHVVRILDQLAAIFFRKEWIHRFLVHITH